MKSKDTEKKAGKAAQTREERLKSALKANIARRKAQMRAWSRDETAGKPEDKD
ncbi:MAG: hypothetical protein ACQEVT_14830 [Pseudomonadota bacterium]|uniref:hypothetical protein n=1 Tax=Roseovarius TaxID=74030 RepID=UPI0022A88A4B|nr:hypothetical protein [Roseovarius sp. EGI FJ00037]MCZ0812462.1 hypothetical protein [Roseovarius sp. EGI FJ00037]